MRFGLAAIILLTGFFISCKKEGFISSPDARLIARADTLRFDTVFTTLGSITKSFTLVNDNDQKLRISSIRLAGGSGSAFAVNVNGAPGTSFNEFELNANDSIYVFVKVTIDPRNVNTPFLVLDSLEIEYNGNTKKVYLQAFGQQARFVENETISSNTTWNKELPYVILNTLTVAQGATLTIEPGTRVYVNATAPLIITGSLRVTGGPEDSNRVIFRSNRIDEVYRDLPGTWPGIIFTASSQQNQLQYASVLNAYQAIVAIGGAGQVQPKLILNECIIHNAYDVGILAYNSSVDARNCLVSQCGNNGLAGIGGSNVLIAAGGRYDFTHCTIATYSNLYQNHKQPVCYVGNSDGSLVAPLVARFTNCIIYGEGVVDDEILVAKGASDVVSFTNVLYKLKSPDPAGVVFTDCIKNEHPLFDTINTSRQIFNFRLRDNSPAIDAAKPSATVIDLDGSQRPVGLRPDMGCYEKQ